MFLLRCTCALPQVLWSADQFLVQPVLERDCPEVDLNERLHLFLHVPRVPNLLGYTTLLRLFQLEPYLLHKPNEKSVFLHFCL